MSHIVSIKSNCRHAQFYKEPLGILSTYPREGGFHLASNYMLLEDRRPVLPWRAILLRLPEIKQC